jgi:hypothetical protein
MVTAILKSIRLPHRLTMPGALLRLEGFVLFAGSLVFYAHQGYNWLVFILLLFTPDLTFAIYAVDKRLGSLFYNLFHTYTLPMLLVAFSLGSGFAVGLQLALIWLAHLGMDRTVGYGLKYFGQFKETHLSRV